MGIMAIKKSPYYTTSEFARRTRLTNHAVIAWIKSGLIDAYVIPGPRYLIPREEVGKIPIPRAKKGTNHEAR